MTGTPDHILSAAIPVHREPKSCLVQTLPGLIQRCIIDDGGVRGFYPVDEKTAAEFLEERRSRK